MICVCFVYMLEWNVNITKTADHPIHYNLGGWCKLLDGNEPTAKHQTRGKLVETQERQDFCIETVYVLM